MALGEPDAGKPLVRFDEGRSQTVIGLGPLQPVGSAYSTEGLVPFRKRVAVEVSPRPILMFAPIYLGGYKTF